MVVSVSVRCFGIKGQGHIKIALFAMLAVCMPNVVLAACSTDLQQCQPNYYNSNTCHLGAMGNGPLGYECKPCDNVYKDGKHFPWSTGGTVTIDKCYIKLSCSNLNPSREWMCTLFYNGENFCTVSNNDNTPVDAHMENINYGNFSELGCVLNTKNCSDFDLADNYSIEWASGNFAQSDQHGTANWNTSTYTWNVNNCVLQKNNLNINRYDRNCTGNVWRSGASISGNAVTGYTINYSNGVSWYYCTHCDAGSQPQINGTNQAYDYGCLRYESDSSYFACACEAVEAGYYSTDCSITYPLNSANIPETCHLTCPADMTTLDPGADSINSCVPKGRTYCDQTGCFTLGTNLCE